MVDALRVVSAKGGLQGFDTNTKLTAKTAAKLRQAGFVFAIRYLSREAPSPRDLTSAEVDAIVGADLSLMAVQHVAPEGWIPTEDLGRRYGANAATHAAAIGLPQGIHVWLDLEGVNHTTPTETVIAYCNAWFGEVQAAGYLTGVYVGANCVLDGDQLYWRLKTQSYWKSGSNVPEIPERGYCMVQRIVAGDEVAGIAIDRNVTKVDGFGNVPRWAAKGESDLTASPFAVPPHVVGDDAAILAPLAATYGQEAAMMRLLAYRDQNLPMSQPRHWGIIDFNLHSAKERLFIFDVQDRAVRSYLCAHGRGSEGERDDGFAEVFSNVDGSNASSLGVYRCAETYQGEHGYSMKLDGLEQTNSNARHRVIVVHGADYVSPKIIKSTGRIGRSLGCPAIENRCRGEVIDALKSGSLLLAWKT